MDSFNKSVKDIDSLAEYFISEPTAKETYRSCNPSSKVVQNYLFNINFVNDDVRCSVNNNCEWFVASEAEKSLDDLQNLILCIACDRFYHLRCTGDDIPALGEKSLPWVCFQCRTNSFNPAAQALVSSKRHLLSFDERVKGFIKEIVTINNTSPGNSEEEEELNYSVSLTQGNKTFSGHLVDMVKKLSQRCDKLAKDNEEMKKLVQFKASTNQQLQVPSAVNNGYAAAVLNANLASTRIDEGIRQSQEEHRSLFSMSAININGSANGNANDGSQRASLSHNSRNNSTAEHSNPAFSGSSHTAPQNVSTDPQISQIDATTRHLSLLTLNEIRKHLPKITAFDGKPEKWLTFQRDVERNWKEGKFTDDLMKHQIRQALNGQALARVEALMDFMTAEQIMSFLKESYGNSSVIVESARQKLLNVKLARPLTHASCVEVTTYIANFMAACSYAGLLATDSTISSKIHSQLEPFHQQMYYEYFFKKFPNASTRMERLDTQFEFLNSLSRTLPIGTFSFKSDENKTNKNKGNKFQVFSTSMSTSSPYKSNQSKYPTSGNDSYKFEIRDKETARYMGYDLNKVKELTKQCYFCSKANHFSVECKTYREMNMDARYNAVKSRNLCINCLLTTEHSARDCDIKAGCGYRIDQNARCSAKHHVTLHRNNVHFRNMNNRPNGRRRSNTNSNAERARQRIQQSRSENQNNTSNSNQSPASQQQTVASISAASNPIPSAPPLSQSVPRGQLQAVYQCTVSAPSPSSNESGSRVYQMCSTTSQTDATVKLFRTFFYGEQKKALGYAIGDSAAEITLVRKDLIQDLEIYGEQCSIEMQWTDSTIKMVDAYRVKLRISGISPGCKVLELDECFAVDDLDLPPRSLNVELLKKQFPYLKNVPFASYKEARPAMLIGSRHAYMIEAIEPVIQAGNNKPIAIRSLLGYSIYGGAPEHFNTTHLVNYNNVVESSDESNEKETANEELNKLYAFSCSIDSLGIKQIENYLTKDEQKALELIEEEIRSLPDGTIEVPLIWDRINKEIPSLPNNFPMVYKRQECQEKKLNKSPELLQAFNDNFTELIKQGYVREATERDIETKWPNVSYIPMSLVVNPNKIPIKTRNVYDASARFQGISLNDKLLMGPNLLVNILNPLMRMRLHKYAFTADIKSMFHRVRICERDQQCQRILWRQNSNENMRIFIQQVMLFGPKCSPFVSQFVKNRTAEKWSLKYPNAARALREFTYMDDMLTSEPTLDSAIEVAKQSIEIFKSINWDLISFQSNSIELLQALNSENVKHELIDLMTTEEADYTTKVLGVAWNPKIDAFVFQLNRNAFIKLVKECGQKPTKRDQCSTIARIFDALGLISHCIIRGRMLLQRSWRNKLDWDEEISDDELKVWTQWLHDLEKVSMLKIPRQRFHPFNITDATSLELHTFSDAGKEAIAAVSYLVANINKYRYVSFVMSKAKVAPIKLKTKTQISEMPRLEMLACLIAARLTATIKNLHKEFKMEVIMWTDSEIVLNWLRNENIKLPKFAISPIEEILEITDANQWHYVESKSNVADIATKFQKFNFGDINSPWFQGPSFLKLPRQHWPIQKEKTLNSQVNVVANINCAAFCINEPIKLPPINCPMATDYIIDLLSPSITSCWAKTVRAIGRALKLYFKAIIPLLRINQLNNMEARQMIKSNNNFTTLTSTDIEIAEQFIIRRMQREAYPIEYEKLRNNKRISNTELLQLNVFIDKNGLMRISSRVDQPKDTYSQKFSPLVPKKSSLSTALLFHYHYKHNHVGIEAQVADIRSKYWMPQVRSALKKVQSLCNYCRYMKANPVEYKMAPLPNIRTDVQLKPFEVTGLDCAGPFFVYAKNGHQKKVWILIFTCTMSRFIHLHLLDELSTLAVMEAILVLWASHGPVKQFISDNGTNFVGAANIIRSDAKKLVQFLKDTNREIESKLAEEYYASWTFIPVQSPWFGAFYERLIQTVKKSIAASIDGKKMSRLEFNIALQDAAHRINNRPLTHNSVSSEDEEVLTPHHIAKNRSGWPLLPSIHGIKEIHDPLGDKDQYRRGRIVAEEISRKFIALYLPVLAKRTKWFKEFAPIKRGDLVLLIDPNKTRKAWERARVLKVYLARDNNARVVDLLLPDGTVRKNRSAKRLAKLDIQSI